MGTTLLHNYTLDELSIELQNRGWHIVPKTIAQAHFPKEIETGFWLEKSQHTETIASIEADRLKFDNRLRILLNIDARTWEKALLAQGLEGNADFWLTEWAEFRDNPWRWFITADKPRKTAVFNLILERES